MDSLAPEVTTVALDLAEKLSGEHRRYIQDAFSVYRLWERLLYNLLWHLDNWDGEGSRYRGRSAADVLANQTRYMQVLVTFIRDWSSLLQTGAATEGDINLEQSVVAGYLRHSSGNPNDMKLYLEKTMYQLRNCVTQRSSPGNSQDKIRSLLNGQLREAAAPWRMALMIKCIMTDYCKSLEQRLPEIAVNNNTSFPEGTIVGSAFLLTSDFASYILSAPLDTSDDLKSLVEKGIYAGTSGIGKVSTMLAQCLTKQTMDDYYVTSYQMLLGFLDILPETFFGFIERTFKLKVKISDSKTRILLSSNALHESIPCQPDVSTDERDVTQADNSAIQTVEEKATAKDSPDTTGSTALVSATRHDQHVNKGSKNRKVSRKRQHRQRSLDLDSTANGLHGSRTQSLDMHTITAVENISKHPQARPKLFHFDSGKRKRMSERNSRGIHRLPSEQVSANCRLGPPLAPNPSSLRETAANLRDCGSAYNGVNGARTPVTWIPMVHQVPVIPFSEMEPVNQQMPANCGALNSGYRDIRPAAGDTGPFRRHSGDGIVPTQRGTYVPPSLLGGGGRCDRQQTIPQTQGETSTVMQVRFWSSGQASRGPEESAPTSTGLVGIRSTCSLTNPRVTVSSNRVDTIGAMGNTRQLVRASECSSASVNRVSAVGTTGMDSLTSLRQRGQESHEPVSSGGMGVTDAMVGFTSATPYRTECAPGPTQGVGATPTIGSLTTAGPPTAAYTTQQKDSLAPVIPGTSGNTSQMVVGVRSTSSLTNTRVTVSSSKVDTIGTMGTNTRQLVGSSPVSLNRVSAVDTIGPGMDSFTSLRQRGQESRESVSLVGTRGTDAMVSFASTVKASYRTECAPGPTQGVATASTVGIFVNSSPSAGTYTTQPKGSIEQTSPGTSKTPVAERSVSDVPCHTQQRTSIPESNESQEQSTGKSERILETRVRDAVFRLRTLFAKTKSSERGRSQGRPSHPEASQNLEDSQQEAQDCRASHSDCTSTQSNDVDSDCSGSNDVLIVAPCNEDGDCEAQDMQHSPTVTPPCFTWPDYASDIRPNEAQAVVEGGNPSVSKPGCSVVPHRVITLDDFSPEVLYKELKRRLILAECQLCDTAYEDKVMHLLHSGTHEENELRCRDCGLLSTSGVEHEAHLIEQHYVDG